MSDVHTLKMHFLLHWPRELLKWGRESNMSANICETCHKTNLKGPGKKTNQHSDRCGQLLQRGIEREIMKDACLASDLYHEGEEWNELSARRLVCKYN